MTGRGKWATVAVLAAVILGGCGADGGGGSDGSGGALVEAAERIEGESLRMRLDLLTTDADGEYVVTGTGVASGDGSQAILDTKITYDGDGPYDTGVRVLEDDIFYRFPYLDSDMPPGVRWVRFDPTTTVAETFMPPELVRFLASTRSIERVGPARIRGQAVTHYRGTVDLGELAGDADMLTRSRYEALVGKDAYTAGVKDGLPVEGWLAEDGRPARIRFTAPHAKETMDMTIDVLGYGVAVEVQPPPENAVISEKEFDKITDG